MWMDVIILGDEKETAVGRPRQADLDERIKLSAVALLGEEGFAGLSVNRICQRAGVPRPTFYRRWPSAVAALVDAFNDRFHDALLVDTGDAKADLLAFATSVRNRYDDRSEEHTSELQSLMRISYAVFCLKKKNNTPNNNTNN